MQKKSDAKYKEAMLLLTLLNKNGFESRLVGGCVRDRLLGFVPKDYDIASTAKPEEILSILQKAAIKAIPTAPEHGTITAVLANGVVEITTLRQDVVTDGRRAVVKFGKSFEEDAKRRDFTINSLSQDINGNLYDYFGGKKDLQNKKLVFVGEPRQRMAEDYLRILRLYRFQSRLGFTFDRETIEAVEQEKKGLKSLSAERITGEMEQILKGAFVDKALKDMFSVKIWSSLFPFFCEDSLCAKEASKEVLRLCKQDFFKESSNPWIYILSALFLSCFDSLDTKDLFKKIEFYCRKMKISLLDLDQIKTLVKGYLRLNYAFADKAESLLFIESCEKKKKGKNFFQSICVPFWKFLVNSSDTKEPQKRLISLEQVFITDEDKLRKQLPLTSQEVIEILGKKPGPEIGRVLDELRRKFLNEELKSAEDMRIYLQSMKS